jgi:hypothetical protein
VVSRFDESGWTDINHGKLDYPNHIIVDHDGIPYVTAGGTHYTVFRWDGDTWSQELTDGELLAVAPDGTLLARRASDLWYLAGTGWTKIAGSFDASGSGRPGRPNVITFSQDQTMFVGGNFAFAGGIPSDNLAVWTGAILFSSPLPTWPSSGQSGLPTTVNLTWRELVGSNRYDVQIATARDFSSILYQENVPKSHLEFVAPVAGVEYYWRVRGSSGTRHSKWSKARTFSVGLSGPLAVELVSPTDGSANQPKTIDFQWTSAPEAVSYHFQLSKEPDFRSSVVNASGLAATRHRVTALEGAEKFYWRVAGVDNRGRMTFSQTRSFTTVIDSPSAVMLLSPNDAAVNAPRLASFSWRPVSNAGSYQFQVATDHDFVHLAVNDSALAETSRTLSSPLDYGTTYLWRVRGRNAGGNGAWSEIRRFTTVVAAPDVVGLIDPSHGAKGISTSPVFTWTPLESALMYQLQVATDSMMADVVVNDSALAEPTDSIEVVLVNAATYYWRVRARNAGGDGHWSETRSFVTVVATPAAVTLGSPEDEATGVPPYATLSWQALEDVAGYHVQIASDSGFRTTTFDDSLLAVATISLESSLPYNTTFYWHVRAGRDDGLGKTTGLLYGPWSATRSFTTAVGTAAEDGSGLPTEFALLPAYPNPFNPSTTISFDLPETTNVRLVIFDALGRVVESIVDGRWSAGRHTVVWDAKDAPSGMYFVRMEADEFTDSSSLQLAK